MSPQDDRPAGAPPDPPWLVRDVRWSDFDDLRETYYLLYEERTTNPEIGIGLFSSRPTLADEVAWFSHGYREVLDGAAVWSVAEVGGHAVGSCVVSRVGRTGESEQAHLGILGILVHRDHRGRGIGSALLTRTLERCRGMFSVVQLAVFTANTGALRLYERFGFRTTGHLPRAVRRGGRYLDEEEMTLLLEGPVPSS